MRYLYRSIDYIGILIHGVVMSVLLQFYIENKREKNKILFWSCVLDSLLDLSKFDISYLDASHLIKDFPCFNLKIVHQKFSQEILDSEYKEYNDERPEVFLAVDPTMQQGSPYSHACSMMKTYYQLPASFIYCLKQFFIAEVEGDYKFTEFQQQIISTIKKIIGIDIIKNESLPGCLSVYRRLPGFLVDGNFNASNGKTRWITVTPCESNNYDDAMVEIEIIDKEKILFRRLCRYNNDFKFEFPSTDKLEPFSELHISFYFFESKGEAYIKIFENHFYLIRSINFSINISGGHSKIGRNRYLKKPMDKASLTEHRPFSSTLDKKNWVDWEEEYKNIILGKDSKYLKSLFFDKNNGREKFLNWARDVISRGLKITIVDPYFDENGLQDFCACISTYAKIRILMYDPVKFNTDTNTYLETIYRFLPGAEVYFIDNFHDRYLVIEEEEETIIYSMSNSWNGTVANYSLFIQEVSLLPALQIEEEIENHVKNGKLQVNNYSGNNKSIIQEKDESVYTDAYINDYFTQLKNITDNNSDCFIGICSELFWAYYFKGNEKIAKAELIVLIIEKINQFTKENIALIISKVIVDLLNKQKKCFIGKNHYIGNDSFSHYDTPEKCLERISHNNYFGIHHSDLKLDYALHQLSKTLFYEYPEEIITEIIEKEKEICVLYMDDNGKKNQINYYISELLICSYLVGKYPAMLPFERDIEEFIEKTKNIGYCRVFFASAVVYRDRKERLTFNELMQLFMTLHLTQRELLLFMSDMYNKYSMQKNHRQDKSDIEKILKEIDIFVFKTYSDKDIVTYAYKAYIKPYEIKHKELKYFLKCLEESGRNDEKMEIEKLLLLCSIQTNSKLQSKMMEIIKPKDYILNEIIVPLKKDELGDIDTAKYHNILPYLGYLFATFLEKYNPQDKFRLQYCLNIEKALVFPLDKFPKNLGLFYYETAFLLSTSLVLESSNMNIKKELFNLLEWYLPVCLNAYSDDFYGLAIQVIDLYTTLQTNEENEKLYKFVISTRDKAIIASNISRQTNEYIDLYKREISHLHIDGNKKDILVFLNIAVNLCLRCADTKNNSAQKQKLINVLGNILDIAQEKITAKEVTDLLSSGIEFAHSPTKETKINFIEIMDTVYKPYSASVLYGTNDE